MCAPWPATVSICKVARWPARDQGAHTRGRRICAEGSRSARPTAGKSNYSPRNLFLITCRPHPPYPRPATSARPGHVNTPATSPVPSADRPYRRSVTPTGHHAGHIAGTLSRPATSPAPSADRPYRRSVTPTGHHAGNIAGTLSRPATSPAPSADRPHRRSVTPTGHHTGNQRRRPTDRQCSRSARGGASHGLCRPRSLTDTFTFGSCSRPGAPRYCPQAGSVSRHHGDQTTETALIRNGVSRLPRQTACSAASGRDTAHDPPLCRTSTTRKATRRRAIRATHRARLSRRREANGARHQFATAFHDCHGIAGDVSPPPHPLPSPSFASPRPGRRSPPPSAAGRSAVRGTDTPCLTLYPVAGMEIAFLTSPVKSNHPPGSTKAHTDDDPPT
jgi:hypothetical protein